MSMGAFAMILLENALLPDEALVSDELSSSSRSPRAGAVVRDDPGRAPDRPEQPGAAAGWRPGP